MAYRNYAPANGFIVDQLGNGDFTTIQAAINAAIPGDTIYLNPGTYTENPALKAGVNISALESVALTPNVTIVGQCTFSSAGSVSLSGIRLQTNNNFLLSVTGSAASIVNLENCYLNCTNNTGINAASSGNSSISLYKCNGDIGTPGIAYFSLSSNTELFVVLGYYTNSGNSVAPSTIAGTAIWQMYNTYFHAVISTSGVSAGMTCFSCMFDTGALATPTITHNATSTGITFIDCFFASSGVSAITVGAGAIVNVYNCQIFSSATNVITGAGTLNYGMNTYTGTSSGINPTTQTIAVGSAFQKIVIQSFTTGTSTYTPTVGMKYCIVELQGCGGGGGATTACSGTQGSAAGGGGAGGYCAKAFTAATIGTSQTVVIGAVGTAGAISGGSGGTGTQSTFGALLTSNGGAGGAGAGANGTAATAAGGAGGSSSSGTYNATGGAGTIGFTSGLASAASMGGTGGASYFGSGGTGSTNGAGAAGVAYGGGGGGGATINSGSAAAGGAGGPGICIVTEYI
jgi:hypothetical protein